MKTAYDALNHTLVNQMERDVPAATVHPPGAAPDTDSPPALRKMQVTSHVYIYAVYISYLH